MPQSNKTETATPRPREKSSQLAISLAVALLAFAAFAIVLLDPFASKKPEVSVEVLIRKAEQALQRGNFASALTAAEEALLVDDTSVVARMYAADASAQLGRRDQALQHCLLIPDDDEQFSTDARLLTATLYSSQRHDWQAEEHLQRAIEISPENLTAHRLLAASLSRHGRRWESLPHLFKVVQGRAFDVPLLRSLTAPDSIVMAGPKLLEQYLADDDPYNQLAAACSLIAQDKLDQAKPVLERCIEANGDLIESHLRYGRLLLETGAMAELPAWNSVLPAGAAFFPETWVIRGEWSDASGDPEQAVYCLRHAISIHPDHAQANYYLGNILARLGDTENAAAFLARADQLREIVKLSALIAGEAWDPNDNSTKDIVTLLNAAGRPWEALAWLEVDQNEPADTEWKVKVRQQLSAQLTWSTPRTLPESNPANSLELSQKSWNAPKTDSYANSSGDPGAPSRISFNDVASSVGLNFEYQFGAKKNKPNHKMYEFTGGGVACLDIDADDWPDLYFTQAGTSPPFVPQELANDGLFRNRRGQAFQNVTDSANIVDFQFGQGVAAGDVNNDGFTDLYIANIDGNRLFINNGDGTFSDATSSLNPQHAYWTSCTAIADVDGDTIPDLYDVTYIDGERALTGTCYGSGISDKCNPVHFPTAPDVLYKGDGAGGFGDQSQNLSIDVPNGDGLGIVIGALSTEILPRIFIANDGRANFYFRPARQADSNRSGPFLEEALPRGLAHDERGQPQACMGIAAADFNGDLLPDFFVTNFYEESNAFYVQTEGEIFQDLSRVFGLREGSLPYTSFGTQPIDADLDGWPDLIITSGHVGALPGDDAIQRMPPQFYRNLDGSRFQELSAETLGPFFDRDLIGRALAMCDWNRDGRTDAAISHISDPVALLQNTTRETGNFLAVTLIGTSCSRDAVGARLVLDAGGRKRLHLVTAGDGFQCTNQKQAIFGLGSENEIANLSIEWPDGKSQSFSDLRANTHLTIRQGDPVARQRP